MPPVKILSFGDNVVDCYQDQALMFPGGNCVNHAVFARRAGAITAYAGAVCDDSAGRLIRDALVAEGVDTRLLRTEAGQTAYCVIDRQDGDRVFVGANLGVSIIRPEEEDLSFIAKVDAVHTGRSSHIDAWLAKFSRLTKVSYDLATVHDRDRIAFIAPHCFLLAFSGGNLSEDGALSLAELGGASGAAWCLVTRGDKGAVLYGDGKFFRAPIQPVKPLDTLGAGDTFIANVLVGLLSANGPQNLLAAAAAAAADTCLLQGAFGYGAPMNVDLATMLTIDEVYKTTVPVAGPAN